MVCRLSGAKPLPEPMLSYCLFDPGEHTSVKFEIKKTVSFIKMRFKVSFVKCRPFCPGGNELTNVEVHVLNILYNKVLGHFDRSQTIHNYLACFRTRVGCSSWAPAKYLIGGHSPYYCKPHQGSRFMGTGVLKPKCLGYGCVVTYHGFFVCVWDVTVYPKKYAHGFVVLCFVVVMQSFIMNSHEVFIHIHQGCFAGTGAIVRLPQCQWSKPDGYGKISQCITTTKHSKAVTVCIFLGIYCMWLTLVAPFTKMD